MPKYHFLLCNFFIRVSQPQAGAVIYASFSTLIRSAYDDTFAQIYPFQVGYYLTLLMLPS